MVIMLLLLTVDVSKSILFDSIVSFFTGIVKLIR